MSNGGQNGCISKASLLSLESVLGKVMRCRQDSQLKLAHVTGNYEMLPSALECETAGLISLKILE